MNEITLDPASCKIANKQVKALKFFTAEQNGLTKNWHGSVWLNPPYGQPLIAEFCKKMIDEWRSGRLNHAIVLVKQTRHCKDKRLSISAARRMSSVRSFRSTGGACHDSDDTGIHGRREATGKRDYYASQHWAEKRLERIRFDEFRCCHCRSTDALQVHHWRYDLFNEAIEDLVTLCDTCHERIHGYSAVKLSFPSHVSAAVHRQLQPVSEGAAR